MKKDKPGSLNNPVTLKASEVTDDEIKQEMILAMQVAITCLALRANGEIQIETEEIEAGIGNKVMIDYQRGKDIHITVQPK